MSAGEATQGNSDGRLPSTPRDREAISNSRRALGRRLATLRRAAGMVQAEAAAHLHYQRSTVANVETGRQNAGRAFWSACDGLLSASGTLLAEYDKVAALEREFRLQRAPKPIQMTSGSPSAHNNRTAAGQSASVPPTTRNQYPADDEIEPLSWDHNRSRPRRIGPETDLDQLLDYFQDQWHQLVRADNLLGPRHALASVRVHLPVLRDLMIEKRGVDRSRVVALAARYAESASWLYEDIGDLGRSSAWVAKAMDWAQEIGDATMTAWSAYRRSQLAMNGIDNGRIIALANAARRDEDLLQPPIIAAALTQEARGLARDESGRQALAILDAAHRWAAHDETGAAPEGHGSFCTPAYIEGQRGLCLLDLGHPKPAAYALGTSLSTLPAVYRRDRAMLTAGLANAYAQSDEIDEAAATARESLALARSTGSQRSESVVRVVADRLSVHRQNTNVVALIEDLEQV